MCYVCGAVMIIVDSDGSYFFFFKQKTAYEMRISDWSSDVCSSDLGQLGRDEQDVRHRTQDRVERQEVPFRHDVGRGYQRVGRNVVVGMAQRVRQEIGRASCRERVCQYV